MSVTRLPSPLTVGLGALQLRRTPRLADPPLPVHHRPAADRLGRFEVRQPIGEGAFGVVFRAFDPLLRRDVAIKVAKPGQLGSAAAKDRFLREARAAATVRHSNVCPVFEVGEAGDAPFIVMAYVPGRTLDQELARLTGPMPPDEAARVVRALAKGVYAAHGKGVLHRDLKPANVLFDAETQGFVLTDFGLARVIDPDDPTGSAPAVQGTPAYMSPEQLKADPGAVGPWSDVYSLGVILFELLTRRLPYPAATLSDVIARVLADPVPGPADVCPGVPKALDAICRRAMAKEPADRFPTARALADALTPYAAPESSRRRTDFLEPSQYDEPDPVPEPTAPRRRSAWLVAAVVVAVAAGIGLRTLVQAKAAPLPPGEYKMIVHPDGSHHVAAGTHPPS